MPCQLPLLLLWNLLRGHSSSIQTAALAGGAAFFSGCSLLSETLPACVLLVSAFGRSEWRGDDLILRAQELRCQRLWIVCVCVHARMHMFMCVPVCT